MSNKICGPLACCHETNEQNLIDFSHVGGLSKHIRTLRELIIFPLIYKDVYAKFNIKAPRGVLFYGPPGTGKTLMAQALANECSKSTRLHVSFFYRKGSDILDKWVGESEKKLRSVFERAANARPSIIFFDEIDALAPTRCSFQDPVHSSVVATLLSLMDGLDSVNGVIVVGATNRLNAIDSALRRIGRFDRELYFPLPNRQARLEILQVHVKSWTIKPSLAFLKHLADVTTGYCGSDLQGLCSNAVLCCLKRNYPDIHAKCKMNINLKRLKVLEEDFLNAQKTIIPASRKFRLYQYRLSEIIKPLLIKQFEYVVCLLESTWPHFLDSNFRYENGVERYSGRLIIQGNAEQGHKEHLTPALLHHLEHLPVHILDIQTLYEIGCRSVEEIFVQRFRQVQQCCPCIIYIPGIDSWWEVIEASTQVVFLSLLYELNAELPVLLVCTCESEIPHELSDYFSMKHSLIVQMRNPNLAEREQFFAPLFLNKALTIPLKRDIPEENYDQLIPPLRKRLRRSRRLRGLNAISVPSIEIIEKSLTGISMRRKRLQISKSRRLLLNYGQSKSKRKVVDDKIITLACTTSDNNLQLIGDSSKEIKQESNLHDPDSKIEENLPEWSDIQKYESTEGLIDIKIYRPKLISLYNRTVKRTTENATCAKLELLYDKLESCVMSFADTWNRNPMLEKIEDILQCHEESKTTVQSQSN